MKTVIACPNCHRRGTVAAETLGKKIQCKKCGQVFMAISDADTDPLADRPKTASEPPKPKKTDDPDDMLL